MKEESVSHLLRQYIGLTWSAPFLIMKEVDAGWSSQVARRAHNPKVAGSNPAPATR